MNKEILFAKNGTCFYEILIPNDFNETISQATKELVEFTKKSCGARVNVIFDKDISANKGNKYLSIGFTSLAQENELSLDTSVIKDDGFLIKTINENIFICSSSNRGLLYGVYEFLEKVVGIRFFTQDDTFIPQVQEIILPELNIMSMPTFKLRTFLHYPLYPQKEGNDMEFVSHTRTLHNWFTYEEAFGGKINLYTRSGNTHNSRFFVPAEKYGTRESTGFIGEFDKDYCPHAEFYHTAEGHEPNWKDGLFGPTIDWTNGITQDGKLNKNMPISVAKIVIEEMKKDILANPDIDFFQLDQEDAVNPILDEELIKKYKASGVLIRFCNVIASELQEWANKELHGRKINIVTFAYQQTMNAPVIKNSYGAYEPIDKTVIPVENLYIRLAYMSFHYYPYGDYRQPSEVLEMTQSWASICHHFWFWGYDSVFTDYIVYNPTFFQAKKTVELMKKMGVDYFIMLSSYNAINDWQADLKSYFWSKLLWNKDIDIKEVVEEYLDGYYGFASKYVKKMIELFENHFAKVVEKLECGHDEYNCYHEMGVPKNINIQLLDTAIQIIEKAEQELQNNCELSDEQKQKLSIKLARVKLTPLWMKTKFIKELCPEIEKSARIKMLDEILELAKYCGVKQKEENCALVDFIAKVKSEM